MKIKISTDSTADIPKELCEKFNISVLPLSVRHKNNEYLDSQTITPQEIYDLLENSDELPVSAQVPIPVYTELFEKTLNEGYTHLIHISLNSKGSGTYQAALLARDLFFEENPDAKSKLDITVIDSKTYSLAYGIAAIHAAKMAQNGEDAEKIIEVINEWLLNAQVLFLPLDLKFVKKSGRISAAAAFVGDAMGLKPIITFVDGESKITEKVRGEANAINALLQACLKTRKPGTDYALAFGNNPEAFAKFKNLCENSFDIPPTAVYPIGGIIAMNAGPNMIGIIFRK